RTVQTLFLLGGGIRQRVNTGCTIQLLTLLAGQESHHHKTVTLRQANVFRQIIIAATRTRFSVHTLGLSHHFGHIQRFIIQCHRSFLLSQFCSPEQVRRKYLTSSACSLCVSLYVISAGRSICFSVFRKVFLTLLIFCTVHHNFFFLVFSQILLLGFLKRFGQALFFKGHFMQG